MNRLLSWTLMVIYLSASIKMLLPFAQDCIAHVFFLEQHLEQVHDNNAQNNHISGELIEIVEQDKDQQSYPNACSVLSQANLALHCFDYHYINDIEVSIDTKSLFSYHLLFHDNLWADDIAPPPQQV